MCAKSSSASRSSLFRFVYTLLWNELWNNIYAQHVYSFFFFDMCTRRKYFFFLRRTSGTKKITRYIHYIPKKFIRLPELRSIRCVLTALSVRRCSRPALIRAVMLLLSAPLLPRLVSSSQSCSFISSICNTEKLYVHSCLCMCRLDYSRGYVGV